MGDIFLDFADTWLSIEIRTGMNYSKHFGGRKRGRTRGGERRRK
jgi:hypothetical protein